MEDFVNFKISQKLKDKGFREKCLAYYDVEDNVGLLYNTQYSNELLPCQYTDLLVSYNSGDILSNLDDSDDCIDAPTISQVLKWMRKEKKIHICVDFDGDMNWYYQIAIYGSTDIAADGYGYNDYELSALAGIEYVLDNLI